MQSKNGLKWCLMPNIEYLVDNLGSFCASFWLKIMASKFHFSPSETILRIFSLSRNFEYLGRPTVLKFGIHLHFRTTHVLFLILNFLAENVLYELKNRE